MINTIDIVLSNVHYDEKGNEDSGYHEIHKIYFLDNYYHVIANIDSIIRNNLLFGSKDTELRSVEIKLFGKLEEYYDKMKDYYNNVCKLSKFKVYISK